MKKMTDVMTQLEKETINTEIESLSEMWFLITLNVAWDLESIKFEQWDVKMFSNELWFTIANDLEKTFKKIIVAIKTKRLEITEKYKKDIVKPWFKGF